MLDLRRAIDQPVSYSQKCIKINCIYHEGDNTASLAVYEKAAHCFACGKHVLARDFLRDYKKLDGELLDQELGKLNDSLPEPSIVAKTPKMDFLDKIPLWQAQLDTTYFKARGLSKRTIDKAMLGHNGLAYTLPIFGKEGTITWLKFRRDDSINNQGSKYWRQAGYTGKPFLYYPPLKQWSTYTGPIVLCEGELDALLLAQYAIPAISIPDGVQSASKHLMNLVQNYSKVVLCFDRDNAGHNESTRLSKLYSIPAVNWPCEYGKDPTELFLRSGAYSRRLLKDLERELVQ